MFVSYKPFTWDNSEMSRDEFHWRDARHKDGVVTRLESDMQVEMSQNECQNARMHRIIIQDTMLVSYEPFTWDNSEMSRDEFHWRGARHKDGVVTRLESDIQVEMSQNECLNARMHRIIIQDTMLVSSGPFTWDNSKMSWDEFHWRGARHKDGELGQLLCHVNRSSTSELFWCIWLKKAAFWLIATLHGHESGGRLGWAICIRVVAKTLLTDIRAPPTGPKWDR